MMTMITTKKVGNSDDWNFDEPADNYIYNDDDNDKYDDDNNCK